MLHADFITLLFPNDFFALIIKSQMKFKWSQFSSKIAIIEPVLQSQQENRQLRHVKPLQDVWLSKYLL